MKKKGTALAQRYLAAWGISICFVHQSECFMQKKILRMRDSTEEDRTYKDYLSFSFFKIFVLLFLFLWQMKKQKFGLLGLGVAQQLNFSFEGCL